MHGMRWPSYRRAARLEPTPRSGQRMTCKGSFPNPAAMQIHEKMIFAEICPPQFRRIFVRFMTTLRNKILMSVKMFAPTFGPWVDVNSDNYEEQIERCRDLQDTEAANLGSPESDAPLDLDDASELLGLGLAIEIFERVHLKLLPSQRHSKLNS
jgi:hypothetical protein